MFVIEYTHKFGYLYGYNYMNCSLTFIIKNLGFDRNHIEQIEQIYLKEYVNTIIYNVCNTHENVVCV